MRSSNIATEAEYCAVNDIKGSNCLNFMAYTLVKAIEDIESRLGKYDAKANNWRYGLLTKMILVHQPFSATPLRSFFEITQEGEGNIRTNLLFFD